MLATFIYSLRTRFFSQDQGQSTVEFAVMVAAVVAVVIAVLTGTGHRLRDLYQLVANILATPSSGGPTS